MVITNFIRLNKGKKALVDPEDVDMLNKYKWHVNHYGYAVCSFYEGNGCTRKIFMHRLLLNTPEKTEVDHINGDPLDNRKSNLRPCTHLQNMCNKRKQTNNTSGYKGVNWHIGTKKWWARITVNGRQISLGIHPTKESAALAYNEAAKKYHGEFASLNTEIA